VAWSFSKAQVPAWVRDFPSEADRAALIALAKASSGKFEKPREMNFSIFELKSEEDAENAVHTIQAKGWQCRMQRQADEAQYFVIDATKQGYVINEQNYTADVAFFSRLADLYQAQYDGWYASA